MHTLAGEASPSEMFLLPLSIGFTLKIKNLLFPFTLALEESNLLQKGLDTQESKQEVTEVASL